MANPRIGDGSSELSRTPGSRPAKKAAKHAAAKHVAKKAAKKAPAKHPAKHAAKKAAAKKTASKGAAVRHGDDLIPDHLELAAAFHHLNRAASVISLLEKESGDDLRLLLQHGMELYRQASKSRGRTGQARSAFGLLRAAEHLGMAGLYTARSDYRVDVPPPSQSRVAQHLQELGPRLDQLRPPERDTARRLCSMARELLERAEDSGHDPHLEYELTMAAEGICSALEEGL